MFKNRLVLALDTQKVSQALKLLEEVRPHIGGIKIGLEAYYSWDKNAIETIHEKTRDLEISTMLDLKLHDIPRTVGRATKAVLALQPQFLTVHASGGKTMLEAACDAVKGTKTTIVAVTLLTSLDKKACQILGFHTPQDCVLHWAQVAYDAGVHWVVCSLNEVAPLKQTFPDIKCIVPGVRLTETQDDHKRSAIVTVENAHLGDVFVVGRPITQASNPKHEAQKWQKLLHETLPSAHSSNDAQVLTFPSLKEDALPKKATL